MAFLGEGENDEGEAPKREGGPRHVSAFHNGRRHRDSFCPGERGTEGAMVMMECAIVQVQSVSQKIP